MESRIKRSVINRERRQLVRRIASALLSAMADSDRGFKQIAKNIKCPEERVRKAVYSMIDGKSVRLDLISDIALGMGYELRLGITELSTYAKPDAPATTNIGDGKASTQPR